MARKKLLIDLGTSFITMSYKDKEVREQSLAIITTSEELELVAAGNEAGVLMGKPLKENTSIISPFGYNGIIFPKVAKILLQKIIEKSFPKIKKSVEVYVTVHLCVKEFEMKTIYSVFKEIGFRDITIVDSLITMLPFVTNGTPTMIIGASGTEIGVLGDEGIIEGCSVAIGGNHLNKLIAEKVEKQYNLKISEAKAEAIKFEAASLISNDLYSTKVTGRNTITGETLTTTINTNDIKEEIIDTYTKLIEVMDSLFTLLPDKLLEVIDEKPIVLAGGGANIKGIESFFEKHFRRAVMVCENPALSSLNGLTKLISSDKTFDNIIKLSRK